uniref:Uncharacterized protein n=1 Tax=Lactuca sativa TaxID=4236 RepID=A0A9R1VJ41_LACSA|nr:hypothetical protein LSAT_V11C500257600 [Lactuca sativa]
MSHIWIGVGASLEHLEGKTLLGNSKKISNCAYTIHLDQWQHWALINVLHMDYPNPMLPVASSTIDVTGMSGDKSDTHLKKSAHILFTVRHTLGY